MQDVLPARIRQFGGRILPELQRPCNRGVIMKPSETTKQKWIKNSKTITVNYKDRMYSVLRHNSFGYKLYSFDGGESWGYSYKDAFEIAEARGTANLKTA